MCFLGSHLRWLVDLLHESMVTLMNLVMWAPVALTRRVMMRNPLLQLPSLGEVSDHARSVCSYGELSLVFRLMTVTTLLLCGPSSDFSDGGQHLVEYTNTSHSLCHVPIWLGGSVWFLCISITHQCTCVHAIFPTPCIDGVTTLVFFYSMPSPGDDVPQ